MLKIIEESPTVEEFKELRHQEGWKNLSDEQIEKSLRNSLYIVHLEEDGNCVGVGRVVGDGEMYFYVQDIIVHKDKRGSGYGKMIMDHIFSYLKKNAPQDAFIGLFSVKGVEEFYKKFGFIERPNQQYGAGMFQFWKPNF
jgi:predicted GNAT family N-acyltransferase